MGETQGKKIALRHCGLGGRGEAVLWPDQPIGEAVQVAASNDSERRLMATWFLKNRHSE